MSSRVPDPTDRTVSRNIRLHRLAKGITQVELGAALGVTFQQVQKYERCACRVASGRLVRIAEILEVGVLTLLGVGDGAGTISTHESSPLDLIAEPQALRLVTAFAAIDDAGLRRLLIALVDHLARLGQRSRER
jgi:transcriptional regulator with XRE-family HTH domain